jgi:hypothetical protein
MNVPVKKIARLLRDDHPPETRAAAAVVLGELGVRDADATAELLARLADADPTARLAAVRAVGRLKVEKALPTLLEKVTRGGEEASAAAEAAARLGAKGVRGLQELMAKVAPGLRRYIAAALSTSGADAAGLAVLLDRDPQVAAAAASALVAKIPTLSDDRRGGLAAELAAVAGDKKNPPTPAAEAQLVRVLVALHHPAAADALWDRTVPPHTHEVRAMALQAVGGWAESPTKEQLRRLFLSAAEADFRVAAPALMILNRLPVTDKTLGSWVGLFHAPDPAARRLAIDKVGDRDTAEVADGLMAQFGHADRGVRDAARAALQRLKAGRKALVEAVLVAEGHDETWQLARAIAGFAKEVTPAARDQLADQAFAYLEVSDHRADPFLFLLREIDAGRLQERLVEKAVALRKKKKYDAALGYLKVVARDPAIGFVVRLELALCGLKVSAKELAPHARDDDPALRSLDTLLSQNPELLLKELEKAKFLDGEDLFYVGFHFAEGTGRARAFGIDVLKRVAKADAKSEAGKAAKNKLKSVGA